MNTLRAFLALASAAPISLLSGHALAIQGQQAVVLGVHPAEATPRFVTEHGVPAGRPEGGRYAAVRLIGGDWGEASYALVYVPPHLRVSRDDLVELTAGGRDVLVHPGTGAVSRVARHAGPAKD